MNRETQKHIAGGDKVLVCSASGCYNKYFSDGQGIALFRT